MTAVDVYKLPDKRRMAVEVRKEDVTKRERERENK